MDSPTSGREKAGGLKYSSVRQTPLFEVAGVRHPSPLDTPDKRRLRNTRLLVLLTCLAAILCICQTLSTLPARSNDSNLLFSLTSAPALTSPEARVHHILAHNPLIDGHNDLLITIRFFTKNRIYNQNFTEPFEKGGTYGQVDLPGLKQGMVGGTFWSAWMPCQANVSDFSDEAYAPVVRGTVEQLDLYNRLTAKYPKYFTPPPTAAAALDAFKQGRLISPLGIEGLHQIGNSLSTLRLYYELGVRYATLTWNCHNAYADAALITDPSPSGATTVSKPLWGGLSEAGRELVVEMNRMGMIVDISHVSADVMRDVLDGSNSHSEDEAHKTWKGSLAPPIFSHSSAYAICPHPRNVPDDVLQLVKKRNSLVMVNFNPDFISCTASNTSTGLPDPYPSNSTLDQVVRHIRHIGDLIGYDHVGIGSDFDGIQSVPRGLEDVSKFPDLVAELLRQGLSEKEVIKVIGGNLLRVWAEVDHIAGHLQKTLLPAEDRLEKVWVTEKDLSTLPDIDRLA